MRGWIAAVAALLCAWAIYAASPYWALYRLGLAVEAGNVEEVAARVNLRALRLSFARQLAAELSATGGIPAAEAQLVASAAVSVGDAAIQALVTPKTIADLLDRGAAGTGVGKPFGDDPVGLDDLDDYLGASTWRGFRNVYVNLPPGEPPEARFRLQLRLGNLRWRLVSLELPARIRRRLAEEVLRRRGH